MKKLLAYLVIFLIIISCSNNDSVYRIIYPGDNDSIDAVFDFSDYDTLYYSGSNSLTTGTNSISYDSNKILHTLIYYALDPANEEYRATNRYTVSAGGSSNGNTSRTNAYNSKVVSDSLSYDLDNFSQKNEMKSKIIDINKDIEAYVRDNDITPIEKDKSTVLYKTIPSTVELGTTWENIYVLDTGASTTTYNIIKSATCIGVSNYAYFFLDDTLEALTEEQIETLKASFDKDYEIIKQYYGTATDTDGNGKVSFLIADLSNGVIGFFYNGDKYSQNQLASEYKSNEADMLYINHKYFVGTDDYGNDNWEAYETDLKATLAHEYQHMVSFDYRRSQGFSSASLDTWLNEGLSMLAEFYCGYASTHYGYLLQYFVFYQGISLITDDSNLDYGLSYLFARYLQIRFGDEYIRKVYNSSYTGIRAIEEATNMDFNELFLDFITMVLVTGRGVTEDTRYNITEFNYAEGTAGYEENGFNLATLIDTAYNMVASGYSGYYARYINSSMFNTSSGYTNPSINQYGFIITKWTSDVNSLTITSNDKGIAGMYYAW